MEEESFDGLKEQVIDTQLCFFCGLCSAVCSSECISFRSEGPELDGDCSSCGQCLEACPGLGVPLQKLDQQVFGRSETEAEAKRGLGIYLTDRNLISGDKEILKEGYTGGKLTAILAYLLEIKEIDAAIVSQWGAASPYPWVSWPVIADTREDIVKGAGSKYVFTPNLMPLEEAANRNEIKSLALVGLGCHIQGLRKLETLGKPYASLVEKVKYTFGLYCGSPMVSKDDFLAHVGELMDVSPQEIVNVDFKRISKDLDVSFELVLKNGQRPKKEFEIMKVFEVLRHYHRWNRCRFCTDYAADYADVSFGGVHVTCRTPKGDDLVNRAIADGWLVPAQPDEVMDQRAEEVDQTMAEMKKVKNVKRLNDYKLRGIPVPNYD